MFNVCLLTWLLPPCSLHNLPRVEELEKDPEFAPAGTQLLGGMGNSPMMGTFTG